MYLRLAKQIAYECPITHISDTFYKLLHKHVVGYSHGDLIVFREASSPTLAWQKILSRSSLS